MTDHVIRATEVIGNEPAIGLALYGYALAGFPLRHGSTRSPARGSGSGRGQSPGLSRPTMFGCLAWPRAVITWSGS
jgi:hypothetical protein